VYVGYGDCPGDRPYGFVFVLSDFFEGDSVSLVFALADRSGISADLSDFADDFGVDFVLARLGVAGSDLMSASLALRLRVSLLAGVAAASLLMGFEGLLASAASAPLFETDRVALMVAVAESTLMACGLERCLAAPMALTIRRTGRGAIVKIVI